MIFATGSTYSQGTPAPDWMAPVMGGRDRSDHHRRDHRRHLRHQILANTLQGMVGLRSLYTDEVVDSHQIMMMNDYMPTKVNDLYKALLSLG